MRNFLATISIVGCALILLGCGTQPKPSTEQEVSIVGERKSITLEDSEIDGPISSVELSFQDSSKLSGTETGKKIHYSIHGIIHKPGEYTMPEGSTLLRAIACSHGYSFGGKCALIIRGGTVIEVLVKTIEKNPSKDIEIKDGDVIIIPYVYKD